MRVSDAAARLMAVAVCGLLASACGVTTTTPPPPTEPPVELTSLKEVMQAIVDPAADRLFEAVAYEVTAAGIHETRPQTNADWLALRAEAVRLAEAANVLAIPGRRVESATPIPGFESEAPAPEDLTPAEIQRLIDADPAAFARLARGLADASRVAMKAIDARDVEGLFASGEEIDRACENCHSRYWYPEDKKPAAGALSQRP